jgi:N-ethylmaleimide reductase
MVDYYRQRAHGGLIVGEATAISEQGQGYWRTPGIYTQEHVAGWAAVADAVHAGGSRMFLQIWHNGRIFHPDNVPWVGRPVAPSAIAPNVLMMTPNGRQQPPVPDALTEGEIRGIIADFALAARNAILAGMDGVELHGANGYIFEQFLNRGSNHRTDAYGGSIANRVRFLRQAVEAAASAVGPERVSVRISPYGVLNDAHDSDPGEVYEAVLSALDPLDIAYLHVIRPVVSGNQDSEAGKSAPDPLLEVRKHFRGKVIVAGGLDVSEADSLIEKNLADAVAFGRWFVANPDLVQRLKNGWPLNDADRDTFYTQGAEGYLDYPAHRPTD